MSLSPKARRLSQESEPGRRRVLFSGESTVTHFDAWQAPKLLLPNTAAAAARERTQLALACAGVNTVYELEQRGARVFDEHELDRLLTDEVRWRLMIVANE